MKVLNVFVKSYFLVRVFIQSRVRLNLGEVDCFHVWYCTYNKRWWQLLGLFGVSYIACYICAP